MTHSQRLTFCRICMGHCGMVATVDDDDRLVAVRADRDDEKTLGYACFKGLQAAEAHNTPDRILYPLKRSDSGKFERIPLERALDEIAERIERILKASGPEAVAGYKGSGAFFTSSASMMLNEWLKAVGSPKAFSTVTIDQSAKAVTPGRMGIWPAGRVPFHRGDVFLIVGGNPLVSLSTAGYDTRNPMKRLKEAKARGMKLIVIDPRRTETARFADLHLQPLPGEDPTLLAGLLRIILEEGWQDREFCQRHVGDLDTLRAAVEPFTPDYVERRAGVAAADLYRVADLFAHRCGRGQATSGTGPDMSPHSNLAEHLIECLNVVCGRYLREGEEIPNPGVIGPRWPRRAEVMPAPRPWESGYRSRIGAYGLLDGELPTGTLPDEILQPGPGQVRCLIVHGGNPASAIPGQRRVVEALRSLELLVTIDPYMTATARLSDYILPPKMQYERADLPLFLYEPLIFPEPFTRYTPAVAKPPAGSEVADDAYFFWSLARRLELSLEHFGAKLDMRTPPTVEELLAIAARDAPIAYEEIRRHPRGVVVDAPQTVEPGDPASPHRFTLAPEDVAGELRAVLAAQVNAADYPYRLAVRRLRDTFNSMYRELPSIHRRMPYNRAYLNPADMAREHIADGDEIEVRSSHGSLRAVAAADASMRSGVVSITHGFGGLPEDGDYEQQGVSANLLTSHDDGSRETINAMPPMSGIPVAVLAV